MAWSKATGHRQAHDARIAAGEYFCRVAVFITDFSYVHILHVVPSIIYGAQRLRTDAVTAYILDTRIVTTKPTTHSTRGLGQRRALPTRARSGGGHALGTAAISATEHRQHGPPAGAARPTRVEAPDTTAFARGGAGAGANLGRAGCDARGGGQCTSL